MGLWDRIKGSFKLSEHIEIEGKVKYKLNFFLTPTGSKKEVLCPVYGIESIAVTHDVYYVKEPEKDVIVVGSIVKAKLKRGVIKKARLKDIEEMVEYKVIRKPFSGEYKE
ncbi:hypothetical protein ACFLZZ_01240 [Nanoarchaeota archaeon]